MFTASLPRSLRAIASKQLWVCPQCQSKARLRQKAFTEPQRTPVRGLRALHPSSVREDVVPFRKQLKDEAKQKRLAGDAKAENKRGKGKGPRLEKWELTVGIEIHAQLNTERKLFSSETALLSSTMSQTAYSLKEQPRPSTISLIRMSRCSILHSLEASP